MSFVEIILDSPLEPSYDLEALNSDIHLETRPANGAQCETSSSVFFLCWPSHPFFLNSAQRVRQARPPLRLIALWPYRAAPPSGKGSHRPSYSRLSRRPTRRSTQCTASCSCGMGASSRRAGGV